MCPEDRWPSLAVSLLLDFSKAHLRLRSHLPNPLSRTLLQFGMILVLPDGLLAAEHLQQVSALYLAPRQLRQKRTPAPRSNDPIDLANQILRKHDVCSPCCHRCPTPLCHI